MDNATARPALSDENTARRPLDIFVQALDGALRPRIPPGCSVGRRYKTRALDLRNITEMITRIVVHASESCRSSSSVKDGSVVLMSDGRTRSASAWRVRKRHRRPNSIRVEREDPFNVRPHPPLVTEVIPAILFHLIITTSAITSITLTTSSLRSGGKVPR